MADTVSTLPEYVEFGLRSTNAGPFRSTRGTMRVLLLEGDEDLIRKLVERTLTAPARGAVTYRPLGRRVMLAVGESHVASRVAPENGWGSVHEALAAFWVPVWAGKVDRRGVFLADRLCMSVPHILVDNPVSHATGRETYGYPKALGRFDPPSGFLERALAVDGFGGDYRPDAEAAWFRVLELAPDGATPAGDSDTQGPSGLVRALLERALEVGDLGALGQDDALTLRNGVRVMGRTIREALAGQMRQVFLKQFRAVEDHRRACHQAVVEALARTTSVKWRLSTQGWNVTINSVSSHPITAELGVRTQAVGWSAELRDYEFDVDAGVVIGP